MRSLLTFLLVLGACSSSPTADSPKTSTGADSSVFDACMSYAERLCADAEPCCTSTYDGFDQATCVAAFRHDVCRPGADVVTANRAVFDEDAIEPCLAAQAEAHQVCTPTWQQTLDLRKKIYAACRVIDGKSPPGSNCSTTFTCKRPDVGTVECIKNVCTIVEVLGEGAECPFPSGSVSVCDEGLTCDAAGLGVTGHCVKAPKSGDTCDPTSLESTECGLGSYCDSASATCKLTDNFGDAACTQSTECVSFDCNRIDQKCAPAPAVLSRETCVAAE